MEPELFTFWVALFERKNMKLGTGSGKLYGSLRFSSLTVILLLGLGALHPLGPSFIGDSWGGLTEGLFAGRMGRSLGTNLL